MSRRPVFPILLLPLLLLTACSNHYVLHPRRPPDGVVTWEDQVVRGELLIRLQGARPAGEGPFPAVIVHPEANHEAREMRGVLHDLAREGYFAVAADYRRRRPNGLYRNGLFVWRHPDDPRRVLDLVRADPRVDPERVAGLGFSQGGVYSLLMAANTGQLEAVVAYYSLSDFETWFQEAAAAERAVRRFVFRTILLRLRKESGAREEGELREVFRRASPLRQAERIEAPVLLIHGDRDTSAPLAESLRLQARLVELGREVDLLVVEDAGHVFNFKNREQARQAWEASLGWLDRHLGRPLEEEGTAEPAR